MAKYVKQQTDQPVEETMAWRLFCQDASTEELLEVMQRKIDKKKKRERRKELKDARLRDSNSDRHSDVDRAVPVAPTNTPLTQAKETESNGKEESNARPSTDQRQQADRPARRRLRTKKWRLR